MGQPLKGDEIPEPTGIGLWPWIRLGACLVTFFAGQGLGWWVVSRMRGLTWDFEILAFGLICSAAIAIVVAGSALGLMHGLVLALAFWLLGFAGLWVIISISVPEPGPDKAITAAALGLFAAELLLPVLLARRFGWSFRWVAPEEPESPGKPAAGDEAERPGFSGQFRLWHLVVLTAAIAGVLGLGRGLWLWLGWSGELGIARLLMIALVCLPGIFITLPMALTLLLRHFGWALVWGAVAAVTTLVGVSVAEFIVAVVFRMPAMSPHVLAINASMTAMTAATLLILRQAGFVFGSMETTPAPATPPRS